MDFIIPASDYKFYLVSLDLTYFFTHQLLFLIIYFSYVFIYSYNKEACVWESMEVLGFF